MARRNTRSGRRPRLKGQPAVTVGPQGRIVIPKDLRARLGLKTGDALDAAVEGGRLVLRPRAQVLSELQALFHPVRESLTEELSEDRRREAEDLNG